MVCCLVRELVLRELPLVRDGDRVGDFDWFGESRSGRMSIERVPGDPAVSVGGTRTAVTAVG
jgi:hypothetical protein